MQKCSSNADKKTDKNNKKIHAKTVVCDGFACKILNDDKKIKTNKNIMIDLEIK